MEFSKRSIITSDFNLFFRFSFCHRKRLRETNWFLSAHRKLFFAFRPTGFFIVVMLSVFFRSSEWKFNRNLLRVSHSINSIFMEITRINQIFMYDVVSPLENIECLLFIHVIRFHFRRNRKFLCSNRNYECLLCEKYFFLLNIIESVFL